MPESVSGVDAVLDGLREKAVPTRNTAHLPREEWTFLADAVAAVHAAADARTQEIVDALPIGCIDAVRFIRRRFPNGGTHMAIDEAAFGKATCARWTHGNLPTRVVGDRDHERLRAFLIAYLAAARPLAAIDTLRDAAEVLTLTPEEAGCLDAAADLLARFPNGGTHDG